MLHAATRWLFLLIFVSVWKDLITFIFGTVVSGWSLMLFHSAVASIQHWQTVRLPKVHCQLLWFTCESVLPVLCFLLDELSLQLLVLMLWCCTRSLPWVPDPSIWIWICFVTLRQDYGQSEGHEILTCSTRGYRLMTWVWIVVGPKQFCLIPDTRPALGSVSLISSGYWGCIASVRSWHFPVQ